MKLVALTGIVGYEKMRLAVRAASMLHEAGRRVGIIDHSDHRPVPTKAGIMMRRLMQGIREHLYNEIQEMMICDVVLKIL